MTLRERGRSVWEAVRGWRFVYAIPEGALIPRGYGLYRFDYMQGRMLVAPLPFNLLGRALWHLWLIGMHGWAPTRYERWLRESYAAGWMDGTRQRR